MKKIMKKRAFALLLAVALSISSCLGSSGGNLVKAATVVDIPDAAFKKFLNETLGVANTSSDITAEQLATLTSFTIFFVPKIKDLTGIGYCKNLTSVRILGTSITKLPSLKNLKKLESLDISRNEDLTSIAGLAKLEDKTVLKSLCLEGCTALKNITPMKDFTGLEELDMEKVKPTSSSKDAYFETLGTLTGLKDIEFAHCYLGNGDYGLGYETELRTLFSTLKKLQVINLGCNDLASLSCVIPRKGTLKKLNIIGDSEIGNKDLKYINQFTKLTAFCYGGTSLTDFSFSPLMPNMTNEHWRWADDPTNPSLDVTAEVDQNASGIQYVIDNPVINDKGKYVAPETGSGVSYNSTKKTITIKPADQNEQTSYYGKPVYFKFSIKYATGSVKDHEVSVYVKMKSPYFKVNMDLNGGTGKTITEYNSWDKYTLANPTKTGYTFKGWTGSNGTTPQKSLTIEKYTKGDLNYTANYSPTNYAITYDLQGGSVSGNPTKYNIESDTITLKNPTKTGYTFTGWTGSSGVTPQKTVTIAKGSTGERNYRANFAAKEYTITYDLDGGTASGNPAKYTADTETFSLKKPTKKGYTFTGWTGSNGTTPQKTVTITQGATGNLSYKANYAMSQYSITYNLNGGSLEEENPQGYNVDTETFTLIPPTKKGYTFTGWTGSNGSTPQKTVKITQGTTGNLTYTANYSREDYTITYDLQGGTTSGNPTTYHAESAAVTLNNPSKEGYEFVGWTGSNGTEPQKDVVISTGTVGNLEYTANYTPIEYTISYDLDGGEVSENPSSYNIESDEIALNAPTKKGYSFLGWTGSNGTEPQKEVTIAAGTTGNLSYKANYSKDTYTITYDLQGASVEANPTQYYIDTEDFVLNNPEKADYNFIGWTGSNGEKPQKEVTVSKGTIGNLHYVANFEEKEYKITYNLDGGEAFGNPSVYKVSTKDFTLKNPTKPGYKFIGWTGSNGATPQKEVAVTKGSSGHLYFVARYEMENYSIAYDLQGGTNPENPTSYNIETESFVLRNPAKENYEFIGWTGSNGDTPQKDVTIAAGTSGNLRYIANYVPLSYSIMYDYQGGNAENPATYTVESETFSLKAPERLGYEFTGWTGSNGTELQKEVQVEKGTTGDKKYVASWSLAQYQIEFDLDGGVLENLPTTFTMEDDFVLGAPVKENYDFVGWTGSNGEKPQKEVRIKGATGPKRYKANYKLHDYTITYDYQGAKELKNPTTFNASTKAFTLKNPSIKGYIFKGWIGSCGDLPVKQVKVDTSDLSDKSYTAVWEPLLYKLPYLNTEKQINKGSSFKIKVYGVKSGYKAKWNNSNKSVVSLSKNGLIKAKKNGTSTIGYRLYDKHNQMIYGFQVKVKVITTGLKTLNTSKKVKSKHPLFVLDKSLAVGKTFRLGFINLEKGCKLIYKSSDKKIVAVSKKGVARAKKKGFAYVDIMLKQHGITYRYRVHFKCEKK